MSEETDPQRCWQCIIITIPEEKKRNTEWACLYCVFDGFIAKKAACRNFYIVFETRDSGPVSHCSITMTKITHHLADFYFV